MLIPVRADPDIGAGGIDGGGSVEVEGIVDEAIDQIASWADIPACPRGCACDAA